VQHLLENGLISEPLRMKKQKLICTYTW